MEKKNRAVDLESLLAAAKGKAIMRVVFYRRAFQVEETGRLVECRDFANQLNFFLQTIGWRIQRETYHNEVVSDAGNYICDYQDFAIQPDDATFDRLVKLAAMLDGEATVKTFQRKDGQGWLLPHNDDYSPLDGTRATILGKVTAVYRVYNGNYKTSR